MLLLAYLAWLPPSLHGVTFSRKALALAGLASGVAGLVSFGGAPLPLPEGELERMRGCFAWAEAEPVAYFKPGNRVRIMAGALAGLEGVILRQNGQTRFVLSIDLILRSVAVNVDACDLESAEPVGDNAAAGVLGVA